MLKKLLPFILLILFLLPIEGSAESFKVIFLNPGHPEENSTGNFWSNVTHFMDAAAKDLDIELVTIYAYRNHILMKSLVEEIAAHKPNYVVLVNEKGIALTVIKELAAKKIPSFMLLNSFNDKDIALLTAKEKQFFIGSVTPNNYNAGKKLLNGLVQRYHSLSKIRSIDDDLKVLALRGDYTTPASLERAQGFADAISAYEDVIVVDNTVANWSKQQAYQKVKGILQHSRVDIIWTANDAMAFGAKKAVVESQVEYPIVIGGINWDVDDLHYPVELSYGGHVVLGAKSLVMLKDLQNNLLPMDERHQVIDIFASSSEKYYQEFTQRLSQKQLNYYDFSKFSNTSGSSLTFTVENLAKSFSIPPAQ